MWFSLWAAAWGKGHIPGTSWASLCHWAHSVWKLSCLWTRNPKFLPTEGTLARWLCLQNGQLPYGFPLTFVLIQWNKDTSFLILLRNLCFCPDWYGSVGRALSLVPKVWFPFGIHALVAGLIPGRGCGGGSRSMFCSHINVCLSYFPFL